MDEDVSSGLEDTKSGMRSRDLGMVFSGEVLGIWYLSNYWSGSFRESYVEGLRVCNPGEIDFGATHTFMVT
jgi:hypothetical protein